MCSLTCEYLVQHRVMRKVGTPVLNIYIKKDARYKRTLLVR